MTRVIVLDTETTGLDPRSGHRIIELACVELQDLMQTGATFHRYIQPDRAIDADAERVHGISAASLIDAPRFSDPEVGDAFLRFVGDSPIVAHNAAFDRGFVNAELGRISLGLLGEERWIDSLKIAQARFPGMYNSLDALCKRFRISLSERGKHGALIDAKLLAEVYLELNGGRERGLSFAEPDSSKIAQKVSAVYASRLIALPSRITRDEHDAHAVFLKNTFKTTSIWDQILGD